MKIAFIGGRDIHTLGGIENYMYNLATQLVRMGHEPVVFCESDHDGEEMVNGFKVIHQKGFKSNLICKPLLGLRATLRVIFGMRDVDIIHYNAWPPSLWSPLAWIFGKRSLMQGHGLEWQRTKYSSSQQRVLKFMEWYTAHLNRNLIMCSQDQCLYFKDKYGRESTAIPTAVHMPDPEDLEQTDVLDRFGIKPKRYFLFLARLVQDKNPDFLIKAFNEKAPEGYQLVIAGNNPQNPRYVEHLHELAKGNKDIIFTGAVYGKDKQTMLRNAYALCIPSTIEGLSIALLEAMSYRLPIIGSDIPANRELLEEDKAVWVRAENHADLISAYQDAVDKGDSWLPIVDYNYDLVKENYTWSKVAEKYLDHIRKILS